MIPELSRFQELLKTLKMNSFKKKKILIIGLGIGTLYRSVLAPHYDIVTVDTNPEKGAHYGLIWDAMKENEFDLAIVCVPNHLHQAFAELLSSKVPIILVEKPGFKTESDWKYFLDNFPSNIVMVKNNIYRDILSEIKEEIRSNYSNIRKVRLHWENENRIPNPGSWFTNKELAFGGVERDLVPHLLSIYHSITPENNELERNTHGRCHNLKSLGSTDYGNINPDGIYDVWDYCFLDFGEKFEIYSDWKSGEKSKIGIQIEYYDKPSNWYEFGLCPEECYLKMVEDVLSMDEARYKEHNEIDLFIHRTIDKLYD